MKHKTFSNSLTRLYRAVMAVLWHKRLKPLRRAGENANIPKQATKKVTLKIVPNIAVVFCILLWKGKINK